MFSTAFDISDDLRVRALGFEQDGQAKDVQFVDASTPPVLGLSEDRNPRLAPQIGNLRIVGETYGARLNRAVKKAWALYTDAPKIEDCTWSLDAGARYWPAAEAEFWHRLENQDFATAAAAFRQLAEQVYDTVTRKALGTLRGAKACSQARGELYGGAVKAAAKTPAKAGTTRRSSTTEDT